MILLGVRFAKLTKGGPLNSQPEKIKIKDGWLPSPKQKQAVKRRGD
jgi:hypothetical protein